MRRLFYYTTAVLLSLLLLESCGLGSYEGRPDDDPVLQTEILRIKLTPDTVATEDTVLIHCVIKDSLDKRFEFFWNLEEERKVPVNGTTSGPKIKWIAPDLDIPVGKVEVFFRAVTVDNGSEDSVEVDQAFKIPIVKQ